MTKIKSTIVALVLTLTLSATAFAGNIGGMRAQSAGNIGGMRTQSTGNIGGMKADATGNIGGMKAISFSSDLSIMIAGNIGGLLRLLISPTMF